MIRKTLTLTAIILVFWASQVQAEVIHSTWVGGEEGSWCEASNWDPATVPDGNFTVTIDSSYAGVDEVEIGLEQNRSVRDLYTYGSVWLANWTPNRVTITLNEPNGLTNQGHLRLWTDELTIEGAVLNYGYFQLDDVEIKGDVSNNPNALIEFRTALIFGNLYNPADAQVYVNDDVDAPGGNVNNQGYMFITPTGELWAQDQFHNSGQIVMQLGQCLTHGIFDNNSTGSIQGTGLIHSNQSIQNRGVIYAVGGGLTLDSWGNITNTGTLANKVGSVLSLQLSVFNLLRM